MKLFSNSRVRSKLAAGTIFLYSAALLVFLAGTAALVYYISYFNKLVADYVSQGYTQASVVSELTPSFITQYISIGIYFGIAFVLFGIGMLYQKFSVKLANIGEPIDVINEEYIIEESDAGTVSEDDIPGEAEEKDNWE